MIPNPKFKLSKYIEPLFTEDYFEVDLYGGRARGGSHNTTEFVIIQMITSAYFRGFMVRATYDSISDSIWQDFKDRLDELSEINDYDFLKDFHLIDSKMEAIYLPNGNVIKTKGFKASSKANTANMKSLAGATHIIIEEAEEVGELEYNRLADSIRTTKAQIKVLRNWNTPMNKTHWLIKNYFNLEKSGVDKFYKLVPKGVHRHLAIFGTYLDNFKNVNPDTIRRYEQYELTNSKYYYNQIMGLTSDGGDSRVYSGWTKCTLEYFNNLSNVIELYGMDFGDSAPTALVHIKYSQSNNTIYVRQLLYQSMRKLKEKFNHKTDFSSFTPEEKKKYEQNNIWLKHKGLMKKVLVSLNIDRYTYLMCDSAQSDTVRELRPKKKEQGYNSILAKKNVSAIINYINRANIVYTEDSTDLEIEYQNYYLDTDINKNAIDGKPIAKDNHLINAMEYAIGGLRDHYKISQ